MLRSIALALISSLTVASALLGDVRATWVDSTDAGELVVALGDAHRLVRLSGVRFPAARALGARGATFGEESRWALAALHGEPIELRCGRGAWEESSSRSAPCVVFLKNGISLNLLLVEQGLAYAALGDSPELDDSLRRAERQARVTQRGLWDVEAWQRHQEAALRPMEVPLPRRDTPSLADLAGRQARPPAADRLRAWEEAIQRAARPESATTADPESPETLREEPGSARQGPSGPGG